ncbi:hypothetical protein L6452_32407 [Arctium lappa]|uniref:Uncharacterized protein n=1 Tax=Arctium lappa TaxID=4217 RepID=A0ACB8Z5R6_ARCLA|nr:hypothetical protein L6452_32407 [Arctium lappa]
MNMPSRDNVATGGNVNRVSFIELVKRGSQEKEGGNEQKSQVAEGGRSLEEKESEEEKSKSEMEANSPEQQPEKTTTFGDSLSKTLEEQQGDEETFVINRNGYSLKPKENVWVPNVQPSDTMMEEYDDFTKRDRVK